jgi:hypothetical protein
VPAHLKTDKDQEGAIAVGRGAPMLLIVLTYIALYQTAFQGSLTMLIYAVGLSIPLIVISSAGGALSKKIKDTARVSGEIFDKIIGVVIVFIGIYFLCMAFHKNGDSIIMSLMQRYPPGLVIKKSMQSVHKYELNYGDSNPGNDYPENLCSQKKGNERPCREKTGKP